MSFIAIESSSSFRGFFKITCACSYFYNPVLLSCLCYLHYKNTRGALIKLTPNMKMSQLSSSIFLLLLTLSFSVSLASLSSILDVTLGSSQDIVDCILSKSDNVTFTSQLIFTPANRAEHGSVWVGFDLKPNPTRQSRFLDF